MSAQVQALRKLLEQRFPDTLPVVQRTAGGVATGVAELDRVFPGGGLPRGRLTAWAPGGGATATLRSACRAALERGERAAWIDGLGVVSGDSWAGEASLFRVAGPLRALECAEELARSGGFALVVVGGTRAEDTGRVRLAHAVREGGGAVVMLERDGFMAGLRVSTRIRPESFRWRATAFGEPAVVEAVAVHARVEALGWSREAEFLFSVAHHDLRMSLEPALVDRRGAAR